MKQGMITGRKNKYGNKKIKIDGITFDSKKEGSRFFDLKMLQKAGEISDLELQPKFEIVPGVKWNGKKHRARFYIGDFLYKENGLTIVEDTKGFRTPIYKIKRQLFLIQYPDFKFIET